MAGRPRQPIDLLVMNGKSHLGKDEIEERRAAEVTAPFTKIEPPDCLSKKQKIDSIISPDSFPRSDCMPISTPSRSGAT